MTDPNPDTPDEKTPDAPVPSNGNPAGEQIEPGAMTLESVIEQTGEMEHLNELVMYTLEKSGGFTGPGDYFRMVHPILDQLEIEIRVRCRPGTSRNDLKLIIQDWIDGEMRRLR